MRRAPVLLVLLACASSGPPVVTVSDGPWRASYRDWSGADVCATEPSWLRDELIEANEVLEKFTARGGAWHDDELHLLEAAARALPPLVEAHGRTLAALSACPYADADVYRSLITKGTKLVEAARAELSDAQKLVRFSHQRRTIEKWRKGLDEEREAARQRCVSDAGEPPHIYFAYGDELAGTTWLFCDGAVVNAPPVGVLDLVEAPDDWPADQATELKTRCFELARVYPGGQIKQPPR